MENFAKSLKELGKQYAIGNYDRADLEGLIEEAYWSDQDMLFCYKEVSNHSLIKFFISECTRAMAEFMSSFPNDKEIDFSPGKMATLICQGYDQQIEEARKQLLARKF
jgi:hypothetical protein